MKKEWLQYLVDPYTKEALMLFDAEFQDDRIKSGELKSSKNNFKIVNGIPRFIKDNHYNESFSFQWSKWQNHQFEEKNIGSQMLGHTKKMFSKIVDISYLNKAIVLDLGCGVGRFSKLALENSAKLVISIDYSDSIEIAKKNLDNFNDNIFFIQCDALNLPLKNNLFDLSFSIGVLHHTPNPKKGFSEMVRVTSNKKGYLAISLYPKGYYSSISVNLIRKFINLFNNKKKFLLATLYCYFSVYLIKSTLGRIPILRKYVRAVIPFANIPDNRWAIMDTFDSITPKYQYTFTESEVYEMLKSFNLKEITKKNWGVAHTGILDE